MKAKRQRAALVFTPTQTLTFKALYGQSFRPPAVVELESNGTFAPLGDPTLRPQELHMGELDAEYQLDRLNTSLAIFRYEIYNSIGTVPDIAAATGLATANVGLDAGEGFEGRLQYRVTNTLQTSVQYAFQHHDNPAAAVSDSERAPRQLGGATVLWKPTTRWSMYANMLAVGDRERAIGDPRPDPSNYFLFNAALRGELTSYLSAKISVSNLLNRPVLDPSESARELPDDIPEAGRTWRVDLTAHF
jgi:outer membrane receptor protein involved in Fe transport